METPDRLCSSLYYAQRGLARPGSGGASSGQSAELAAGAEIYLGVRLSRNGRAPSANQMRSPPIGRMLQGRLPRWNRHLSGRCLLAAAFSS